VIRANGLAALGSGAGTTTERTRVAAQDVLEGRSRGWRALLPFAGPAFVASIAYVDPGNFATNVQGGANFGGALPRLE
jgi:manganese transport protein